MTSRSSMKTVIFFSIQKYCHISRTYEPEIIIENKRDKSYMNFIVIFVLVSHTNPLVRKSESQDRNCLFEHHFEGLASHWKISQK